MIGHGRAGRLGLLLLLGALFYSGWRSLGGEVAPRPEASATACTCPRARLENGWCAACGRGYVASLEIRSRILFDALDAHGHRLDPAVMACTNCKRLFEEGGFCESCRFGWVGGLAYMSRITYDLAHGRTRDLEGIPCATCRELAGGVGWCERCAGGWTGNVYFERRSDYDDAVPEFARLEAAIATSRRCENCALALLVDRTCPLCKITYAAGKAVTTPAR